MGQRPQSMRALKPASRLKEGAKRRNAPTTQRRIQLPVVAGRTSPPRHVPKVHGAQKERRMYVGTFFPWEEMCLLENLLAAVRQDGARTR